MSKFISFLLAICMLAVLCGCQQYDMDILERGAYSREDTLYLSGELEPDYAMNDGTTIEPVTLVDTDGVVAMLLGITNTTSAPELEMVFDKGNCEYLDFEVDYMLIDGWQVSGGIMPDPEIMMLSFINFSRDYVKFNGQVIIGTETLAECGLLDEIHEIEMHYSLTADSRHGEIAEGVYTTETSNEGEPTPYSSDGPVLLDEDGIFIQMYAFQTDTFSGNGEDCNQLILYVENNSDRRIYVTVDDAEIYEKEDPEEEELDPEKEEEETDEEKTVIVRKEKNGRYTDSVPMYGSMNVCAGQHSLGSLQTADIGDVVLLSDDDEMSFSLKVYDYETYDSDDPPEPLSEQTLTLTTEDMFSPQ